MPHLSTLILNLFTSERDRLVLWLPVLLGCGIAFYFGHAAPQPVWPAALMALAATVLALCTSHIGWRIVLVAVAALSLGYTVAGVRVWQVEAPVLRETIFFKQVHGTIDEIQQKDAKTKLILRDVTIEGVAKEQTPKLISVSLRKRQNDLQIGDDVQLPAMLFPPPTPALPGGYDFARMFYFNQLGAVGFSPRAAEVVERVGARTWRDDVTALRLAIADRLQAQMGSDESAVAAAMMVGDQSRISEDISDEMRVSGIYHILSISGMHMTLAVGLLFFAVRFLLSLVPSLALRLPIKKVAALIGLVSGLMYLLLAGSPVAAVRAYIMVACVMLAILFDRKGISLYALAWAASLILLIMPEALLTAGFQMSFAATLAIVVLYERYGHVLYDTGAGVLHRFRLYLLAVMLTSLAATFYTTPLALYHFNRVAIWGIATNMLMVPLSSFWIMPAAIMVLLLMPMGWEAPAIAVLNQGIDWMISGSRWISTLPYADMVLPSPSFGGFVAIVLGGLWLAIWRSPIRWIGLLSLVLGLLTVTHYRPYDMIISDDAKRVAYRTADNRWVFVRGDIDSFEAETWLRTSGAQTALTRAQARKSVPELRCDKSSCMIERSGYTTVVSLRKDTALNLCESGADIIISDQRLYAANCHSIPHLIDHDFLTEHGAVGLCFTPAAVEAETTDASRGRWPWSKQMLVEDDEPTMIPSNEREETP